MKKDDFMQMEREKKKLGQQYLNDKRDFKSKAIVRGTERLYIMIKGTIQHKAITLVKIYAPNTGTPKYVKQISMDIKGEIGRYKS